MGEARLVCELSYDHRISAIRRVFGTSNIYPVDECIDTTGCFEIQQTEYSMWRHGVHYHSFGDFDAVQVTKAADMLYRDR